MPISLEYFKKTEDSKAKPKVKWLSNVLAMWPGDGLFYNAELLNLNRVKNTCRVRFEDNLEMEVPAKDLHCQLDDERDDEEIVCCVCGSGHNEPNIIMCDICNQGYHLNCHKPEPDITKEQLDDENHSWFCNTCVYIDECQESAKKRSRQSTAPRICVTPAKPKRAAEVKAKCQSEPKRKALAVPRNFKKTTPKVKLDKPLKAPAAPSVPTVPTVPNEARNSQKRKSKQTNGRQNTAELSVPGELVETQIVEFAQPDLDIKAEREVNMVSPDDGIVEDTCESAADNQTRGTKPRGKVDTLEPELVVVAETLAMKPSSVGKQSLNAVVDSARMVDLVNDTTSYNNVSAVTPRPLAITNGTTMPESPTVIKAQKKQRKAPKIVAPAS